MAPIPKNPIIENIKNVFSVSALIFSISMVMGLIFTEQTGVSRDVHPGLAFVLLWFAILWLSFVEGGQASLVGLAVVDRSLFKESHPTAWKCCELAHTGDGLDRYLLGRQFLVVFVVFTVNICGAPVKGADLWGLPDILINIFLGSGLAMILFTTMVGQLNSQVNASHCMLDYLNNIINYGTLFFACCVEFSGLIHAAYVLQIFILYFGKKEMVSKEAPRTPIQNLFFFGRCFMSLGLLCFAFVVTLTALFQGKTTMWEGVPPGAAVVVFFLLMTVVGLLEGMQISFFLSAKVRPEDRGTNIWAKRTCEILFFGNDFNLSGFMIGRQLCVVSCMFFIARVTSLDYDPYGETLWGVSPPVQKMFNMGFLGAHITTVVGSIAWQLAASVWPVGFLSSPFTYIFLRICLFLEATGICNGAYVIAMIHKYLAGFQRDEVYIGTAHERAERARQDDYSKLQLGAGHIIKLPGFQEDCPARLKNLVQYDESVRSYLDTAIKQMQDGKSDKTEIRSNESDSEDNV